MHRTLALETARPGCLIIFRKLLAERIEVLSKPPSLQAACGATYGVVPFVSQRALGVVCGMVGAGGNAGSAIVSLLQILLQKDSDSSLVLHFHEMQDENVEATVSSWHIK